jgi:hypothetical protein
MNSYDAGTLLITDRSLLVMLTSDGPETEMNANGPVRCFYSGLALPTLAKWRGAVARKVGHIDDIVLPFLKTIDITPAVKEDSELTERELLQKISKENADLKRQVAALAIK